MRRNLSRQIDVETRKRYDGMVRKGAGRSGILQEGLRPCGIVETWSQAELEDRIRRMRDIEDQLRNPDHVNNRQSRISSSRNARNGHVVRGRLRHQASE